MDACSPPLYDHLRYFTVERSYFEKVYRNKGLSKRDVQTTFNFNTWKTYQKTTTIFCLFQTYQNQRYKVLSIFRSLKTRRSKFLETMLIFWPSKLRQTTYVETTPIFCPLKSLQKSMSKGVEICRYFVYGVSRKYLDQIDVNSKCRVLWDSPTHTHKKSFPLRISLVNVKKSTENCIFIYIDSRKL